MSSINNKTYAIILCGGISKRWNNYLGIEKHFATILGESIIEHTIRLLSSQDVFITLITRDDNEASYRKFNHLIVTISKDKSLLEFYKIKSTFDLWHPYGKTVIMMGDVWFTSSSISKIFSYEHSQIIFWGRQRKNYHTKCKHGEIFAISFSPDYHQLLIKATDTLENLIVNRGINIAGGWGIYNIVSGLESLMSDKSIIKGKALYSNFHNLIDITDDIDSQKDYENLKIALSVNKLVNLFNAFKMHLYYSFLAMIDIIFECNLKLKNKKLKMTISKRYKTWVRKWLCYFISRIKV
ncbi:MAG: hypothetical protein NT166_00120 [Candidatus Aminicenantes bacterium]|nr:hypothetical protein [Candidatus Aminicenantes bacterium]